MEYLKEDYRKIIPIEQRSFEWTVKTCIKLLNDIYYNFINGKDFHLGIIMCYISSINSESKLIYDGQQRTVCLTLILKAICIILREKENNFAIDSFLSEFESNFYVPNKNLNEKEKNELDQGLRTPKITSIINEHDKKSIKYILNIKKKADFNITLVKGEYNSKTSGTKDYIKFKYKDSKYKTISELKKKLEKDISKDTLQIVDIIDNNIVKSYIHIDYEINEILKTLSIEKLTEFIRYLDSNIFIDLYDIYCIQHANNQFKNINSEGQGVSEQTILKNIFINSISGDNNQIEFIKTLNTKINIIEENKSSTKIDFDKILHLILLKQVNFNNLESSEYISKYEELFKNKSLNSVKFLNHFEEIIVAIHNISNNKWIKIMQHSKRLLSYEAWKNLLIPIYFKNNDILDEIINIIIKYEIRVMFIQTKSFNSFEYSQRFMKIINDSQDICQDLKVFFENKLKEYNINDLDKYSDSLNVSISDKRIKAFLLYYEYFNNTDITTLSLTNLDKEHIIAESTITSEGNQAEIINNIGNLTLLESKNSINGNKNKGNRSIKNKKYEEKLPIYKESSIKITNQLVEYNTFDIETINIRKTKIAQFMFNKSIF